jgi:trans-aconitate 2-methyltransferase
LLWIIKGLTLADWNPDTYLAFADERTRPSRDLLAQVPLASPRVIYDLGCGPGNSTALLAERFPDALITGIDNSPAMIDKARASCAGASFEHGDLTNWMPARNPDLLFSNAAFQWVPQHLDVIARLSGTLKQGGAFAVQMPDNLDEPSHRLMRDVAESGLWRGKLGKAAAVRDMLPLPTTYYARLKPLFRRLDIWHTIYNHPLDGTAGIVRWLSSTGLKPFIDPLDESERREFLAAYEARLGTAYPQQADGCVLLRFPRLFLVGVR